VTSGILHGAPSKTHLAGRKCTRRAPGMNPHQLARRGKGGPRRGRGGIRREPSSLQSATCLQPTCPSAKKQVFFLAPFSLFFPVPPPPSRGWRPHDRGRLRRPAMHGGPCTARAMRVAPRHGRPWQARLGEGGRGQPTTATEGHEPHGHPQPHKGTMMHVNPRILRLFTTIHCLLRYSKDSPSCQPLGPVAVPVPPRPSRAPPEPWIRGEQLWTRVRL
jgi:hypothetical protein